MYRKHFFFVKKKKKYGTLSKNNHNFCFPTMYFIDTFFSLIVPHKAQVVQAIKY